MPARSRTPAVTAEAIWGAIQRNWPVGPPHLPFEEVEMSFDAIVHSMGGARALKYGGVPCFLADWKEGSVVVHKAAALISEWVRPQRMPTIPALDWGVDPNPYLRRMARRVALEGAFDPTLRLVSAFEGSDEFFVALVNTEVDLAKAEKRYARYLAGQERRAAAGRT